MVPKAFVYKGAEEYGVEDEEEDDDLEEDDEDNDNQQSENEWGEEGPARRRRFTDNRSAFVLEVRCSSSAMCALFAKCKQLVG